MQSWMLLVGLAGAGEVPEVHRVWVPSCGQGLGRAWRGTVLGPTRSPWTLDPREVRAVNGVPVGSEASWSHALDAAAEDTRCTYDVALADPMVFDLVGEVPGPMRGDVVTRLQVLKWLLPHLGRQEMDAILAIDGIDGSIEDGAFLTVGAALGSLVFGSGSELVYRDDDGAARTVTVTGEPAPRLPSFEMHGHVTMAMLLHLGSPGFSDGRRLEPHAPEDGCLAHVSWFGRCGLEQAGFRTGDLIRSIDGVPTTTEEERAFAAHRLAGRTGPVLVVLRRDGVPMERVVEVVEEP